MGHWHDGQRAGQGPNPGRTRRLKRVKNALLYYLVAGLVAALRWLPHRLAVMLGAALGALAGRIARPERRRALDNLARISPAPPPAEARRVVRRMFRELGRNALECVIMDRLRPRLATARTPVAFDAEGERVLREALEQGRGVVFATGHLGNFELMAAAVARLARVSVLYKPSYDSRFTNMINRFREKSGVAGLSVTHPGHLKAAVRALRAGQVVGILVDQPVPGAPRLPFLGRSAATTSAPAALARATGARLVFGAIQRQRPCHHAIFVRSIPVCDGENGARATTLAVSAALEQAIRRCPEQWLWSLDRWRSTESGSLSRVSANCIPASNF